MERSFLPRRQVEKRVSPVALDRVQRRIRVVRETMLSVLSTCLERHPRRGGSKARLRNLIFSVSLSRMRGERTQPVPHHGGPALNFLVGVADEGRREGRSKNRETGGKKKERKRRRQEKEVDKERCAREICIAGRREENEEAGRKETLLSTVRAASRKSRVPRRIVAGRGPSN